MKFTVVAAIMATVASAAPSPAGAYDPSLSAQLKSRADPCGTSLEGWYNCRGDKKLGICHDGYWVYLDCPNECFYTPNNLIPYCR